MSIAHSVCISLSLAVALWAPAPASAGRSCGPMVLTEAVIKSGLDMAEKTRQALDATGDKVVLLARSGQDLSKYGLNYSHVAFAYQQPVPEGGYHWRVVHKLNYCGTAEAHLFRQGLGDFFLDDPWRYQAAWVAPNPQLQERLQVLLQDDSKVMAMHDKAYNMVSYPWSTKYQQSNQWLIETLAVAAEPGIVNREQAQAWLQFKGYQPTTLKINAFERLGARVTAANVAFDDHPNDKRFSDRIETVTADSVFAWLARAGLGKALVEVKP